MGRGDQIETRGHVVGFSEEIGKAAAEGNNTFFGWFDKAVDVDAAFDRGRDDFQYHVLGPLSSFLSRPEQKVALEIGYGGGRLLAAACGVFGAAIGVDIHDRSKTVAEEFQRRSITNFRLFKGKGNELPVESSSVDLVYSFIVLQHVEKISVFEEYVVESARILKDGGLAVLYFGRWAGVSQGRKSRMLYLLDRLAEAVVLRGGYREMPAVVNDINLIISLPYAKHLATRFNFEVIGELVSGKNIPGGSRAYGAQHALVLRKKQTKGDAG